MPLIVNNKADFPISEELERENIFVMDKSRAEHQDIRPLRIALLNLMPAAARVNTEIQFFRLLGNTPLQIEPILLRFDNFTPSTGRDRLEQFYQPVRVIKESKIDALIVTGANLELDRETNQLMPFSEIHYYEELKDLIFWARENLVSTVFSCLASHFALQEFYGLKRALGSEKNFGIFNHYVMQRDANLDLLRGMNDIVPGPHSRWGDVSLEKMQSVSELDVLLHNKEHTWYIATAGRGREIYIQGHPEYDREDLAQEYQRDKEHGQKIPCNYYPDDDDSKEPLCNWKADSSVFFRNWVNFVYQTTEY